MTKMYLYVTLLFMCSRMSFNHLNSLHASKWFQNLTDEADFFYFLTKSDQKVDILVKNDQNLVIFCYFQQKPAIFTFYNNFFGLSIQFRYTRLKNLRSLMPFFIKYPAGTYLRAQRLINLKIPVLVQSLKSSNVELSLYLDGRLFKCCLSAAANP